MTQLTCDNACGYIEFTAAPRAYIGDQCPECCEGHMTTDSVTIEPTPCFHCGAPLDPEGTGRCTWCNRSNWLRRGQIIRRRREEARDGRF